MKSVTLFAALLALASTTDAADTRVFEMRTYYAHAGKLEDLHRRFRDHTCRLFEKHGMENIGYWVPLENPENKLVYVLAYPSREARETAWKAFLGDPAWKTARADSEKNGPLVAKAESVFLRLTDYSPAVKPAAAKGERVFELRTYTASPGNLGHLNARFREHTLKLFEKHGMANVAYWNLMSDQKGADNTLIYILAHKSREAAKESFAAFGKDPEWQAARKASEDKAGGPLTVKGGVQSLFMKATDYSPLK